MLQAGWPPHGPSPVAPRAGRATSALALLMAGAFLPTGCSTGTDPGASLPTVAATAEVGTICLAVTAAFAEVESEPPRTAIEETISAILGELGLAELADEDGCDARLEFAFTFRPLSAEYSPAGIGGGRTCYTGAASEGEATLFLSDGQRLHLPLGMRDEPSSAVTECPGPAQAPFDSVWRRPVLQALGEWWGLPALVAAIELGVAGAGGVMADMGTEASPAVPFLMGMLEDADPRAPAEGEGADFALAAQIIVQISPEAAVQAMPLLTAALEEGERSTRLQVIRSLGDTAPPVPASAIDALVLALSGDEDPYLRAEAARILGEMGTEAGGAVPALVEALDDRGAVMGSGIATVGEAAAAALGAIGDPEAAATLIADLTEGGRAGRAAIDALAAMGPSAAAAVPALIEALAGDYWASASVALQDITGQSDYGDAEVYRRWWHSLECAAAASATEVTVTVDGGEVRVTIDEARPIPSSFEDIRPCGPLSFGCQPRPDVVAEGGFFAAHYALANQTDHSIDLPANCTHAVPRRQCPGPCWWITDGRTSWPATGWAVWEPWAISQGSGTAESVEAGDTVLRWVVFDVPEEFIPAAIAWPLEDGSQACLALP
jgi:hypothetical protein